jgi:hypothetical protein
MTMDVIKSLIMTASSQLYSNIEQMNRHDSLVT